MAGKTSDSLKVRKAIDAGKLPLVWLWAGEEQFLKDELFRRVVTHVGAESMDAMNVSRFRGGEDAMDPVVATCRTIPMLSPQRAVLIKDIEKIGRKDRELLLEYVQHPAPETHLVLSGTKPPGDAWHRSLAAAGAVPAAFWIPFEDQIVPWIEVRFKDLGKTCPTEVARELLDRCGGGLGEPVGLQTIAPEIEKVALGTGDRETVTADDLDVISRNADERLRTEVIDRVTRKDAPGALRALDGALLFKQNNEIRLVAMLTHRLLNIAFARDWQGAGNRNRPNRIWPKEWEQVGPASQRFSDSGVRGSLAALAAADRSLKSLPKNPRTVLEQTILTICK